ncbi:MAG: PQQ-dependent sugar dehydrogenase [Actinomycetota bacterium]
MRQHARNTHWALPIAVLLVGLALPLATPSAALGSVVPAGFEDQLVAKVGGPTAIAFTPDGRILVTSHFGQLFVIQSGALVATPAIDLGAKVCDDKERGLLGVAVDPAFASNHYIYLYYTFKKFGSCPYDTAGVPVNRVSRFVLPSTNVIDPGTETVLIDNVPNEDGIHNAGDLEFGKDGDLYISIGDGGCDYAFDSGCGSQNDASRDPNILLGKILRITPSGGIPAGNPFTGPGTARCNTTGMTTPGTACRETFAWGLRNPFRIAFDPNAAGTRFHIDDVGQSTWEEIDLGRAGADYGWNVREGPCARGSRTDCGPPPAGMTNPVYAYDHNTGCTAVTGGAFVPNGLWPAAFDHTYLYGDFVCGKIIRLTPVAGGGFTATDFVTGLGTSSITTLKFGPYGSTQAAYYLNYLNGGEVRRIAFTGGANRSPTAVAMADKTSGAVPLAVAFDGRGSSDPDGDPLTYDWNFGDGSAHATGSTASHTYGSAGTYTMTLIVKDGRGGQGSTTLRIDAGNTPPVPVISSPSASKTFAVGATILLHGSATDAQDGTLGDAKLTWVVLKHHDTHQHPFLPATTGNDIPIVGPDPEDFAATDTTYLEIRLTATDSKGLSATVTRNLYPRKVPVTLATEPPGLRLGVNGTTVTGPSTVTSWKAYTLNVSAADQVDGSGRSWAFAGWSDDRAASHAIVTPGAAATYTAAFTSPPLFRDGFESGDLSRWTTNAGLAVQQQQVFTGSYAARAISTGAATFASEQLSFTQPELYDRFRFKVIDQGANNVTLGKFRSAAGDAILALYRSGSGALCLRNEATASSFCSATRPSIGVWHSVQIHARVGGSGRTAVWLDGTKLADLSGTQALGPVPIGRVQLGNDQTGRTYDVAFDAVVIDTQRI